jgi:hypothetical protein
MKNVAFLMLAAYMLATAGCGSLDTDVKPTSTGYQQYFECKVNGLLWKPDTLSIITIGSKPVSISYFSQNGLTIKAVNTSKNESLGFNVDAPLNVGTYPIRLASYKTGMFVANRANYLKITRMDSAFNASKQKWPLCEGEFVFTTVLGADTTIVTDGKFGLLLEE